MKNQLQMPIPELWYVRATIENKDALSKWLGATVYPGNIVGVCKETTNEHIQIGKSISSVSPKGAWWDFGEERSFEWFEANALALKLGDTITLCGIRYKVVSYNNEFWLQASRHKDNSVCFEKLGAITGEARAMLNFGVRLYPKFKSFENLRTVVAFMKAEESEWHDREKSKLQWLHDKAAFFAAYYGQEVVYTTDGDQNPANMPYKVNSVTIKNMDGQMYLKLNSLRNISDEDQKSIVAMVKSWDKSYENMEELDVENWLDEILTGNCATYADYVSGEQIIELIDFLRSRSYLLPFRNITVEQLLEQQWAVEKEIEN